MSIFISEITVGVSDGRRFKFRNIRTNKSGAHDAANNIVSRGCRVGGRGSYLVISHNEISFVKVRHLKEVQSMPSGAQLGDCEFRWLRESFKKGSSRPMVSF